MVNDRSIDFVMAAMNEHSFATFLFWNRTENIISRIQATDPDVWMTKRNRDWPI